MKSIIKLLIWILLLSFVSLLVACNCVTSPEGTEMPTETTAAPVTEVVWKAKESVTLDTPSSYTHLELLTFESLSALVESLDAQSEEQPFDRSYFSYDPDYFRENSLILIQDISEYDEELTILDVVPEADGLKVIAEFPAYEVKSSIGYVHQYWHLIEVYNYIPKSVEVKLESVLDKPHERMIWSAFPIEVSHEDLPTQQLLNFESFNNFVELFHLYDNETFQNSSWNNFDRDYFNRNSIIVVPIITEGNQTVQIANVAQNGDGVTVIARKLSDKTATTTASESRYWCAFVSVKFFLPDPEEIVIELHPEQIPITALSTEISYEDYNALPHQELLTFESANTLAETYHLDIEETTRSLGIETFHQDYFIENSLILMRFSTEAGKRIIIMDVQPSIEGASVMAAEVPDDAGASASPEKRYWCVLISVDQYIPKPAKLSRSHNVYGSVESAYRDMSRNRQQ